MCGRLSAFAKRSVRSRLRRDNPGGHPPEAKLFVTQFKYAPRSSEVPFRRGEDLLQVQCDGKLSVAKIEQ
jgi:hypothetical protein